MSYKKRYLIGAIIVFMAIVSIKCLSDNDEKIKKSNIVIKYDKKATINNNENLKESRVNSYEGETGALKLPITDTTKTIVFHGL